MQIRWSIIVVTLVLAGWLGYWLAGTAVPKSPIRSGQLQTEESLKRTSIAAEPARKFRKADRSPSPRRDDEALQAGALPGQRNLVFKDQAALDDFLKRAGNRIQLMGRIDALNALRVGFSDADDLASLLDADSQQSFVYPVDIPAPSDGTAQPGAVALGAGLLDWLGVSGDNSAWGSGVSIAIDPDDTTSPNRQTAVSMTLLPL